MATTAAETFVNRIEQQQARLASLSGEHLALCKAIRDDIKAIYRSARDDGHSMRVLKGMVKYRELERDKQELERKQLQIPDDFDADESLAYAQLAEQLGGLGAAAQRRYQDEQQHYPRAQA